MRNISNIAYSIHDILIKNRQHINYEFMVAMESFIKSLSYSAPELLQTKYYFIELGNILNYYIPENEFNDINKHWNKEIINIFTDKKYT